MDENNKEYVDFIIQMIKEINKNSDFLPKDVCHVLNRRPIIDHLRNSVKNDDDFETILSGWINRCIIKPSECIWQAIFAVSVLKKQNSIKEKISILYSQTENLYKNVENDDGKKAEYLDALLALFWHLEKHTGDQIALLSSNIAALKKQQTRYLNINEFEEKSKYISEQEMFYLLFNRVKTNVQKSSNDLYQELCDHLCPSNSFISDFHDHISSVGNNVLESIEELLMIGGDILTKSFNTISVNTDPEKTLSAYIAQSRKSTGLAQMQLLLRNTENLKEAQYLSTTEIKNNSFSVPSIYLEFKHNKYSWTIDNKNSDELIKNYITGRKLTQKDIAYYNKRLSECINNYFSNSESRYRIIPDGEITFYCFLYILAKIFNCNNGFNITHWLEEKCNHSITVNNSLESLSYSNFIDRIFGGNDTPKLNSFINWMRYKANKDESIPLPFENMNNGTKETISSFINTFLAELPSGIQSIDIINKLISYIHDNNYFLDEHKIDETSPVIFLELEEIIRKNEVIPRCFAVFEIIPELFETGKLKSSTFFAICTLQGMFLEEYKNNGPHEEIFDTVNEHIKARIEIIKSVFEPISQQIIKYEIEQPIRIAIKNSLKSAKAAIMSRNMSHNLGSHVLAYLRTQLNDVQTLIKENSLYEFFPMNKPVRDEIKNLINHLNEVINNNVDFNIKETENIELPFLIGLGYLINYLQERQDFIATIATNHFPYSVSVNFKDMVYDDLNHDYKAIRHPDSLAFKYKGDNLLLDNIARSEGYRRKDIVIKFREFNGLNEYDRFLDNYELVETDDGYVNGDGKKAFDDMHDINVVFPGGAVGRQAFYSILENFIRNTAKHAPKGDSLINQVVVNIDILNPVSVVDDMLVNAIQKYNKNEEEENKIGKILDDSKLVDFYRVELYDNTGNFNKANETLLKALKDDYIDEYGSLKEDYKGIKEMRISAAWLRFLEDESDLEHKQPNADKNIEFPPVLQLAKKGKNICYVFYLLKPKDLLFVTDNKDKIKELFKDKLNEFVKMGWELTNYDSFDKKRHPRFRLIVFDQDLQCENRNRDITKYCHSRYLIIENVHNELENFLKTKIIDHNNWKENVYNYLYGKMVVESIPLQHELPKIFVLESKPGKLKTQKAEDDVKVFINEDFTDEDKNLIVFKDHFDTQTEYESIEKHFPKISFVESISGNNSTDRLIRKSDFGERWYLEMIESALTKIVVIDERLWSLYSEIDESELDDNTVDRSKADFNFSILKRKNIHVLNLIESEETFEVIEINTKGNGKILKYNNEITLLDYKQCVQNDTTDTKKHVVDFVCVHQGLVDKIYKKFGNIGSGSKADFVKNLLEMLKEKLNANFIIVHSGRSRPPQNDLPVEFPFIQYSAINHSIKDCKHSLTELLYSARSEAIEA
jgi:hypothetical protein